VLKSATVGGEGSWDYIYADVAARRLYIPRHPSSADLAKPGRAGALFVRSQHEPTICPWRFLVQTHAPEPAE
jgi:hypothetical protein